MFNDKRDSPKIQFKPKFKKSSSFANHIKENKEREILENKKGPFCPSDQSRVLITYINKSRVLSHELKVKDEKIIDLKIEILELKKQNEKLLDEQDLSP